MAWLSSKKDAKLVGVLRTAKRADERRNEDLWLSLRTAFDEIQDKKSTSKSFNELYANAYAMVTRGQGERLYRGLCSAVTEHLTNKVRPVVLAKVDEDFLQTLNKAWDDHQMSMTLINDIVKYMDQVYVPQSNADSVKKMGVLLFRDEVARYSDVRDHLCETMLGMMEREREGKPVDRLSLRKTCEMMLVLGLDSRSVEEHIIEESERVKECLDESTVVPIVEVVEEELFGTLLKAIGDMEDTGVERMVKHRMTEDLAQLFQVLKCVPGGVETLLDCVSKHLRCLGRSVVNEHEDSVSVIPKVMDLKDLLDHFLQRSFNNEQLVKQKMATDFEYILSWPSFARKLPMHLSAFVDDMMRQGVSNMTKQEIDELLDKVIEIFRCMQEKELFKCYYKHHLAKRLLFNKSSSDEAEISMVAKLRNESGYLYTSRMEAMLRDMRISNDMMKQFKEAYGNELDGVCINVRVLMMGFWHAAVQHFRRLMEWFLNIPVVEFGEARPPTTHSVTTTRLGTHDHRVLRDGKEGAVHVPIDRRSSGTNLHPQEDDVPDVRADPVQKTQHDVVRKYCLRDESPRNKPGLSTEFAENGQSLRDSSYQGARFKRDLERPHSWC
ncbi:hypothetical protein MTO96_025929 [Rhipicephalus appendiculatus]